MSKEMDELNKVYKEAYAEQTENINSERKQRNEQGKKQREEQDEMHKRHREEQNKQNEDMKEARKPVDQKVSDARKAVDARVALETEAKKIYNSLISGLANEEYDTKKVMEQALAEATIIVG